MPSACRKRRHASISPASYALLEKVLQRRFDRRSLLGTAAKTIPLASFARHMRAEEPAEAGNVPAKLDQEREAARDFRAAAAEDRALRSALGRQLIAFEHLLDDQQRAAFARSLKGRMYNVLGYVFSVYCVYKVPT